MNGRRLAVLASALLSASACALDVQTIRYPEAADVAPRAEGCEVRLVDWYRTPPASCVDVGDVYVGDSGLSFPCGRGRAEQRLRAEACRLGADTALVRRVKDSVSVCHQLRARLLICESSS